MTTIRCLKSYQLHCCSLTPAVPESWTLEARRQAVRISRRASSFGRFRCGTWTATRWSAEAIPTKTRKKRHGWAWNPAMGDISQLFVKMCKRWEVWIGTPNLWASGYCAIQRGDVIWCNVSHVRWKIWVWIEFTHVFSCMESDVFDQMLG